MTNSTLETTAIRSQAIEMGNVRTIAAAAFVGLALIFAAGFAPAHVLHNAAHDFRHVQNYPCH